MINLLDITDIVEEGKGVCSICGFEMEDLYSRHDIQSVCAACFALNVDCFRCHNCDRYVPYPASPILVENQSCYLCISYS